MTAIKAAFSDFRIVKGRKVAQLIFEVPLEAANSALAALGGLPMPDGEMWAGIARLDDKVASKAPKSLEEATYEMLKVGPGPMLLTPYDGLISDPPNQFDKPHRHFDELPLPQQAGILAKEPSFWKFLVEQKRLPPDTQEYRAADYIRNVCGVQSRSEIKPNTLPEKRWQMIRSAYEAWKIAE